MGVGIGGPTVVMSPAVARSAPVSRLLMARLRVESMGGAPDRINAALVATAAAPSRHRTAMGLAVAHPASTVSAADRPHGRMRRGGDVVRALTDAIGAELL